MLEFHGGRVKVVGKIGDKGREFEIGRTENSNPKLEISNRTVPNVRTVQFEISNFGFEFSVRPISNSLLSPISPTILTEIIREVEADGYRSERLMRRETA